MKRGYLAQRLRALGRQVGVVIFPRRLRHTFDTQLLNVGCPVTSIQKLPGYENLNTTMVYARLFDQTVMRDYFRAVDVIEAQPGGAWFAIDAPDLIKRASSISKSFGSDKAKPTLGR